MRPIHSLRLVALLLLYCPAKAQDSASDDDPDLPRVHYPLLVQHAASPEGFVPNGWVLEKKIEGDLNGDGAPDFVLVLHQKSRRNIIKNPDGMGEPEYDSNPRILAVLFADKKSGGYALNADNHLLIPRRDSPTISDPFNGVKIVSGSIRVDIQSWTSAGSWFASNRTFTFRYQNGSMILIGFDSYDYHRGSGAYAKASVNYLTRKAEITKGIENDKKTKKVKWKVLAADCPMPSLQQIGDGFEFQPPIPSSDTNPIATDDDQP